MLYILAPLPPSSGYNKKLPDTVLFLSADNELTVGKVYAAHMIFDYYKQNRAKKLQQQNPSGISQVWS